LNILLLILISITLVLNLKASWVLSNSTYYDKKQKLIQYFLVWLLPVLGGVLVWSIAVETSRKRLSTDLSDNFGYGANSPSESTGDIGGGSD